MRHSYCFLLIFVLEWLIQSTNLNGEMKRLPPELTDLITKIYEGNIVLFIGNGASVDAGGPKTEDLVIAIKKRFPSAEYQSEDFLQTCTDVMETTLTKRSDLEEVITKRLYGLKPSVFHKELPLHIWPAIFTTNYDYLIEQCYYDVGSSGMQIPDPIFSDQDPLALHDREKVKIFKLMGCIVSQHPHN